MITRANPKQHTVMTTTLVVDCPQDYTILEQQFRLVRYVSPDKLLYRKNPTDFGRVHNAIRDQIDYPYKSFQHDRLEGRKKWAIYVLYPHEAPVNEVTLSWFEDIPLPHRNVAFKDLPMHILLKLLLIRFCRGENTSRFVGQDKCYVYARSGGGDFHYCVEMEIKGALTNIEDASKQEFCVIPHTKRFAKSDPPFPPSRPLFGKRPVGDKFFFLHLKSGMVEQEPSVYDTVILPGKRAQIKYYDPRNLDAGRGKIVFDFIQQFLSSLAEVGIVGHAKQRTFTSTQPPKTADLPIELLTVIGVYDNRLRRAHDSADYVELFNGICPTIHFTTVKNIEDAPQGGLLVLLDAKADDFEEDGLLAGKNDPYSTLYQDYPGIPKQSINVNLNDPDALQGGGYLDYPMMQPHDESIELKLKVALNELYLKCALIRCTDHFTLPLIPDELAFIRRGRFDGKTFTAALWFETGQMHFAHLGDPAQSEAFYQLLERWDVDWDEQYDRLLAERRRIAEDGAIKDLPSFDVIVGRDLFVAIEDLEERVLYDYAEMSRRRQEQKVAYPIEQLRLSPHYDKVKRSTMIPLEKLSRRGLLDGSQKTATATERQSLIFYQQLQEYDAFLGKIAVTHPILSYQELTSGEWLERIARIFGSKADSENKYHSKVIAGLYKKLGMFLSEKGQDVLLYQGIWHDETNAFLVGSPTSMNLQGQERAHLIRRFQIMQGSAHFDKNQLLATMGVLFVRYNQYTVSPYHFHLIDLYVENVLRYIASLSDNS